MNNKWLLHIHPVAEKIEVVSLSLIKNTFSSVKNWSKGHKMFDPYKAAPPCEIRLSWVSPSLGICHYWYPSLEFARHMYVRNGAWYVCMCYRQKIWLCSEPFTRTVHLLPDSSSSRWDKGSLDKESKVMTAGVIFDCTCPASVLVDRTDNWDLGIVTVSI